MNVQNVGVYRTGNDYLPTSGRNIFERGDIAFNPEGIAREESDSGITKTIEQKTQDLNDAYAVMTNGVSASRALNKNETIQTWLNQLGFYSGKIDGKMNSSETIKSLKNFQRVYGLTQTSQMNDATYNKLKSAISCYRTTASKSNLGTITNMVSGHPDFKEAEIRDYFAKTWTFFRIGMGLTTRQASGVLGNIMAESGCVPDNAQDTKTNTKLHDKDYKFSTSDSRGYGLIQWTLQTRKQLLKETSSQMGLAVSDINAQFACFRKETERDDLTKSAWNKIKKTDLIDGVTGIFLNEIEMPAVKNYSERYKNATTVYSVMK